MITNNRRCLVPLAISFAAALSLGFADKDASLREAIALQQKATAALKKNDCVKAREYFTKALSSLPGFPEAEIGLGHLALQEKAFAEALGHYQRAREGFVRLNDRLFDVQIDRFRRAQEEIRNLRDEILAAQNPSVKLINTEAVIREKEAQIQRLQAIKQPVRGKASEPPGEVFFYIGNAHYYLNQIQEAVEAWQTCADRAPDFPLVQSNLAMAHLQLGHPQEAAAHLAKAEALGMAVNPNLKRDIQAAAGSEAK